MSESLRNDGRIWVPKQIDDTRSPDTIPEDDRDYILERRYPSFGNLVARDVASRAIKREVDAGRGVGPLKNGAYLDFGDAIERLGKDVIEERYSNLFEMYERITDENPYVVPMRIYPAVHYTMGGLWVDYDLMSNVPGLFVLGEANFADQGANRLGASALMQGLADGYFVLPNTINGYLAPLLGEASRCPSTTPRSRTPSGPSTSRCARCSSVNGNRTVDDIHRELGKVLWDNCGMARTEQSLTKALSEIPAIRDEFWKNVRVLGENETRNQSLEKAGRVADFLEFGELMVRDALHRNESCGGHFREEYQTEEGEALRDDEHFSYVAAWEFTGVGAEPHAPQGAARVRVRPPLDPFVQVKDEPMTDKNMRITLTAWRQAGPDMPPAQFETYDVPGVSPDMSFLEMLDIVNERLTLDGKEPIAFDHDCREGICGSCGMMINGVPHGPERGTATCQLHMRKFRDGDHVTIEPWRAASFPLVRDLIVDRGAFDRIIESGGYVTRADRRRARRQPHPDPEGCRRRGDGRGGVHRLRRLRGRVPQRRRAAVHRGQAAAPQPAAAGSGRALGPHRRDGRDDGVVLRLLHEPPRVRGRVPEVDLDRLHRADEPRLRQGAAHPAPPRRPAAFPDSSAARERSAAQVHACAAASATAEFSDSGVRALDHACAA